MSFEVALLLGLFIKHFICDFPLQATPWMYKNKGSFVWIFVRRWWIPVYPHPGGVVHAGLHAIGTSAVVAGCLMYYGYAQPKILALAQVAAFTDFLCHYVIDFSKINVGKYFNLKMDNSEWFWILLGFDQLLHALTYFYIVHGMPLFYIHCRGM